MTKDIKASTTQINKKAKKTKAINKAYPTTCSTESS